jgi:hypothetical protein
MNELLPDMTIEEATAKHNELKSLHGVMRSMLLEMRDRKGWKALGYESWEDYGEKEWDYSRQHLHRLADAASVQISMSPLGDKEIPERHLRPLTQVPEEERQAIWEEATRIAEENGKKLTAKIVESAVENWRQQYLDERNSVTWRKNWKKSETVKKKPFTSTTQARH